MNDCEGGESVCCVSGGGVVGTDCIRFVVCLWWMGEGGGGASAIGGF